MRAPRSETGYSVFKATDDPDRPTRRQVGGKLISFGQWGQEVAAAWRGLPAEKREMYQDIAREANALNSQASEGEEGNPDDTRRE